MAVDLDENLDESFSDRSILDYLRRHGASTISDLKEFAGLTTTAVRKRVVRLMEQGLVVRQAESQGRGRPTHRYSLTASGDRLGGDNFQDLASVLWTEIRAVKDPEVRRGLLSRIAVAMAGSYANRIEGSDLRAKMKSLAGLMQERDVSFDVVEDKSQLPVLTAWACPYPELVEQDRGICSMENMLFSEILGESVRLSGCRLDGESCCTFEANSVSPSAMSPSAV